MSRIAILVLGLTLSSSAAFSEAIFTNDQIDTLSTLPVQTRVEKAPLKWKIGDTLNYALMVKGLPVGSLTTKFISKTQTEYIVSQKLAMFGKEVEIQTSYDKATGEVTNYNIGGVPMPVEMGAPNIISQNEEFVTVPAGAFNCTRYEGLTKAGLKTETWINTKELPLNGTARIITYIKEVQVSFDLVSYAD